MMPPKKAAAAAAAWWTATRPDPSDRQPGDRAAFARLRRCATVAEAMQEQATVLLFRRLASVERDLPSVALAAAVLAHVREDVPGARVARLVGPASIEKPETALLKPLRFRRLMETTDWDDRLTAFRRLVALAERRALPVNDLARALLFWTDATRQRWVLEYWNALPPQSVPTAAIAPHKEPAS